VAAFKKAWTATGGGRDIDSNPGGMGVIQAYYTELYEVIKDGDLPKLAQKLGATP
jgi:hypothetical protein